jgi:hypothetical protein
MDKKQFIESFDNFCSNIELEYVDIYGQTQNIVLDKLLKTTNILLNDLPFDTIDKIFYTKTEFQEITAQYFTEFNLEQISAVLHTYKIVNTKILNTQPEYKLSYIKDKVYFLTYDKLYINNTYIKFNDYYFFKKYFNIDLTNIDIYYPIKIVNKKDFTQISNLFNIDIKFEQTITFNKDNFKINDKTIKLQPIFFNNNIEMYNNYYYNLYQNCSLFNILKYFIYGLLQYKQVEFNDYHNIPMEKTVISKTDENIDKTVSITMIERLNYNTISETELAELIQPIPTEILYANEQHIILQGIYEDLQKFCNNIEKYISGGKWKFDNVEYETLQTIDEKIDYLENTLKNYNDKKLDMSGYNSYFRAVKTDIIVGDSDKLNFLNLTESENNFLHIEKILQSNDYPLFAKLNLINQIKNTISIYRDTIKTLYLNKSFYNEQSTEILLPQLRSAYNELAKAVASQEQPASLGNPNYDGNPNEYPFRQEQP